MICIIDVLSYQNPVYFPQILKWPKITPKITINGPGMTQNYPIIKNVCLKISPWKVWEKKVGSESSEKEYKLSKTKFFKKVSYIF